MLVKLNTSQQENVVNVMKANGKEGPLQECELTGGTKNDQKQKESNDKNKARD